VGRGESIGKTKKRSTGFGDGGPFAGGKDGHKVRCYLWWKKMKQMRCPELGGTTVLGWGEGQVELHIRIGEGKSIGGSRGRGRVHVKWAEKVEQPMKGGEKRNLPEEADFLLGRRTRTSQRCARSSGAQAEKRRAKG